MDDLKTHNNAEREQHTWGLLVINYSWRTSVTLVSRTRTFRATTRVIEHALCLRTDSGMYTLPRCLSRTETVDRTMDVQGISNGQNGRALTATVRDRRPMSGEWIRVDDDETRTYQDERPTTSLPRDRPRGIHADRPSITACSQCFSPTAVGPVRGRSKWERGTRGKSQINFSADVWNVMFPPACPVAGKPTEFDLLRSRDTATETKRTYRRNSEG